MTNVDAPPITTCGCDIQACWHPQSRLHLTLQMRSSGLHDWTQDIFKLAAMDLCAELHISGFDQVPPARVAEFVMSPCLIFTILPMDLLCPGGARRTARRGNVSLFPISHIARLSVTHKTKCVAGSEEVHHPNWEEDLPLLHAATVRSAQLRQSRTRWDIRDPTLLANIAVK